MRYIKTYKIFESDDSEYQKLKADFLTKFPTKNDFNNWYKAHRENEVEELCNLFQCPLNYANHFERILNEVY